MCDPHPLGDSQPKCINTLTLVFSSSLYTYDMRYLEKPVTVHMDHVSAVLDVDYSPTGREFVSASFDKSIRIFPKENRNSRSVPACSILPHITTAGLFYSNTTVKSHLDTK